MTIKNNRLNQISKYVKGDTFLDVGCDHGWLGINLLQSQKVKHAIFSDINPKPLAVAQKNLLKSNLNPNQSTFLQTNGLNGINLDQITTINISGVGGNLITEILNDYLPKLQDTRLILCPNNNSQVIRKLLLTYSFKFFDDLVFENSITYDIIIVDNHLTHFIKPEEDNLPPNWTIYGRAFENPLYLDRLNQDHKYLKKIITQIPKKNSNWQKITAQLELINTLRKRKGK